MKVKRILRAGLSAGLTSALLLSAATLAHAENSIHNHLEGYWSFNSIEGGQFKDGSSKNQHAKPMKVTVSQDGKEGGAAQFNGVDSWVDIPDFSFDKEFTLAAWVKLDNVPSNSDSLVGQLGDGQDINFFESHLRIFAPGDVLVSPVAMQQGVWTHIAIARRDDFTTTLYLNGQLAAESVWQGTFMPKAIGRGAAGAKTKGLIDEVYLYSKALAPTQIAKMSGYDLEAAVFSAEAAEALKGYVKNIQAEPISGKAPNLEVTQVSDQWFKVNVSAELAQDIQQPGGWGVNITPDFEGDFHWTPHLTPSDQHIISDHAFRAPAMIWASSDKVLTIIPDLDARAESPYRWFMDLDVPDENLEVGISDYRVAEHVMFRKRPATHLRAGSVALSFYVVISDNPQDVANPWRRPLDFLWNKHGKELAERGEPLNQQLTPFVEHTYDWAFNRWADAVWQEFELNGKRVGAPAFIVNYTQSPNYEGEVNMREFLSIWNQAWFCSLRSAEGLYRYARRTNNAEYLRKANMTKELALAFPQTEGLFHGLVATEMHQETVNGRRYNRSKGWDTLYFGNSDRNPYIRDAKKSPYHILDMSTTADVMLNWYQDLEQDSRLLEYAKSYADKLVQLQDQDGFYPGWIDTNTLEPLPVLAQSPETSKSVSFLLKLADITGEAKYKESALKAMDAVIADIVPTGRWEDFETYWSCSKWWANRVGQRIERNNMFKQNNFSTFWTAEALLDAYERTKDKKYLELGQRTLDELLMTQALWQPPYMYVTVFGGFGVMNADGEWNDARQAVFSELIIRYGDVLNKDEYRLRGIAALKASFSMMYCPENANTKAQWQRVYPFFNDKDYGFMMENYGHGGYTSPRGGGIGEFTIYDWGNGLASAAYNRILDKYGADLVYQNNR